MSESRDAAHWAAPVSKLKVSDVPTGAVSMNVDGRQVVGPLQGFGQMWQKTYRVRLSSWKGSPEEVVTYLKKSLPDLMPDDSQFYPSVAGVEPGEVVLINARMPGIPGLWATGVLVMYSDEASFTLMCPEGHMEAGWNTFSAYREEGVTVAQIQSLARANDPVYEFGFRYMGGASQQERIWRHVLTGVASHYNSISPVETHKTLVDDKLQWAQAKNVWYNAAIRSTLGAPARFVRGLRGGGSTS